MIKRTLTALAAAVGFGVVWAVLVVTAALQGWFDSPIAPRGDPRAFMNAAVARADAAHVGNVAIALIDDGRVFDTHFSSQGDAVDSRTLFQMASVSKWGHVVGRDGARRAGSRRSRRADLEIRHALEAAAERFR